jgi:hypothetical protein
VFSMSYKPGGGGIVWYPIFAKKPFLKLGVFPERSAFGRA